MSSYGFIKELIEKEHTPTPAYVFDLDKMKEFVKKVQSCLGESCSETWHEDYGVDPRDKRKSVWRR